MERSETIGDLITAIAKAQLEFTPALKQTTNSAFGSKYADLAANIDAVRPALNKHGVALLQFPDVDLEHQTVSVMTALHHGEQFVSQRFEAPAVGRQGFNVQSIGAATTYLRRYGLQALCGLASEDDDGNSVAEDNRPIAKPSRKPLDPVASRHPAEGSPQFGDAEDRRDEPTVQRGPTDEDFKMWQEAFREAQTIEEWNTLIVPIAKERVNNPHYGRPFIVAMSEEAKRRGYVGDRSSGNYKENPIVRREVAK